jgi:DNA-binding transcriptional ArsR family regulator
MTLLDDTLQLLSDQNRRNIMYLMKEAGEDTFEYYEITEAMVEKGYISEEESERFGVRMAHVHLPKMEKSGLVEQDQDREKVHYFSLEKVENLLEDVKKYEESDGF